MKIIYILTHQPDQIIRDYIKAEDCMQRFPEMEYLNVQESVKWVGFFKKDWHHNWGVYVKKLTPDIKIECWRPYGDIIKNVYSKEVDGIMHRVFPSNSFRIIKYGSIERSNLMLMHLRNTVKEEKNVILHFFGAHTSLQNWLLNRLKSKNIPIIVQQLGGWFSYFNFKKNKNILQYFKYIVTEKRALKYVTKYLTASVTELNFLKTNFPHLNPELFLNGIDFDDFAPINKQIAREEIGLDDQKKMILYVGRLTGIKNVEILIDAYLKLKGKRDDLVLYLVGGYKGETYYRKAKDAGAVIIERTDNPINVYFAAADVYVIPVKDYGVREFGGFGIAPLEALAMNTPVISENLKHSPCNTSELAQLGIYNVNFNKLEDSIEHIINHPEQYSNCREIIKKHFDIKKNSVHIVEIYKTLIKQV